MNHIYKPAGLHHITLRVNDIQRAEAFYEGVLGFTPVKKMGQGMTVYEIGTDTLVVSEAETAYDTGARDYRVDHFGFEVPLPGVIDQLAEYFRDREVTIITGPANRKTGRFLFVTDPDGNLIEFYSESK